MTSVKHFAAYGAVEGGKEYNTVDMSRSACLTITCRRTKQAWMPVSGRGDGRPELAQRHACHL
ncbi:beta-galactosidase [Enterobacter cloacae]|uniref:Beta-galactosidase n=1 Tax=Enterobacter cloacae TaxID=550 RepID=A0A377LXC1_ENTCL|nr:beta-galactosidase [Enterobacter cloacae]